MKEEELIQKNMKEEEDEEEKKVHNVVYPVWSNNDISWRRNQFSVPPRKIVTVHKDSKQNYKNQSSN